MDNKKLKKYIEDVIINTNILYLTLDNNQSNIDCIKSTYLKNKDTLGNIDYSKEIAAKINDRIFRSQFIINYLTEEIIYLFDILPEDMTARGKYKEIEFLRHVKNALMHKNRFSFKEREPKYDAVWKDYKIKKDLENKEMLFSFISIKDTIGLLEHIKNML